MMEQLQQIDASTPDWIVGLLLFMAVCSGLSFVMNFQNWQRIKKIQELQELNASAFKEKMNDFIDQLEKKDDKFVKTLEKINKRMDESEKNNREEHFELLKALEIAVLKMKGQE